MKPEQLAGTTQELTPGSLLSTINPVSQFFDSNDYVPDWLVSFFDPNKGLNAQRAAHLTSKIAAGSLATALAVYAVRSAMHNVKLDKYNKAAISPTDDLTTIYRAKPEPLIKSSSLNKKADFTTDYNMWAGALPLSAATLVAIAMASAADKHYDSVESKLLDKRINTKKNELNNVIVKRVKRNRGVLDKPIQKTLAFLGLPQSRILSPKTERAVGLLAAILAVAAAGAGFAYHNATNPNNIKFLAMQKGILRYVKAKKQLEYPRTLVADNRLANLMDSALTGKGPLLTGDDIAQQIGV